MTKRDGSYMVANEAKVRKLDTTKPPPSPGSSVPPSPTVPLMEKLNNYSIESDVEYSEELEEVVVDSEEEVKQVWTPDQPLESNEELTCAPGSYNMYHTFSTEYPCLSFDILNMYESTTLPAKMGVIGGTQADVKENNKIYIMNWSHITSTLNDGLDSDDFIADVPVMKGDPIADMQEISHPWGTVNKIVACSHLNRLIASFGEDGQVRLWDIRQNIKRFAEGGPEVENNAPMCSIKHQSEGFGLEFNTKIAGGLASACRGGEVKLHRAKGGSKYETIVEANTVDNVPIEDLSHPLENGNIVYLAGGRGHISRLDERVGKVETVVKNGHGENDINVIECIQHQSCSSLIATGGDDKVVRVWDERSFDFGATLSFHKDAVSSIAWSPIEASVMATSSYDDSILIWDLSVEKADEPDIISRAEKSGAAIYPDEVLFDHRGDKNISQIKFHKHLPDTLISTGTSGFRIFQPRFGN